MKFISVAAKVGMLLATIAYAGVYFFLGWFLSQEYGLFGVTQSTAERGVGYLLITIAFGMVVIACFLFKENILPQYIGLLSLAIVGYLSFVLLEGIGSEVDTYVGWYLGVFLLCGGVYFIISRKLVSEAE